ncbi:MAG: radical SAM protein, partial [Clostridia bacterium]|nr:radical SAM protein [Clostridia bacterium]
VMPYIETVQDRIVAEVYRGCIRGCRFCQAGTTYRPVREKSPEVVCKQARKLYENSGYDEISLCSLSISDYSEITPLTGGQMESTDDKRVSKSLPSLREDS